MSVAAFSALSHQNIALFPHNIEKRKTEKKVMMWQLCDSVGTIDGHC